MGTRSLTTVIEAGRWDGKNYKNKLMTMYRQYDGYPSGMGLELAEFLNGGKVVNGISFLNGDDKLVFNGAGCLAAQLVAHFKDGAGGFYLHKPGQINCGEEYRYEVIVDADLNQPILLKVIEVGYMSSKGNYINKAKTRYFGPVRDFEAWLEKYEQEV
jgi:hypothetical protein